MKMVQAGWWSTETRHTSARDRPA